MRTKSFGLSRRRFPCSSRASSQFGPITASSTLHLATSSCSNFREIRAKGNGIDVHEHEVATKFAVQPVHNTAGIPRTVSSAIADKDFGRHRATLRPGADVLAHYYHILSLSMK